MRFSSIFLKIALKTAPIWANYLINGAEIFIRDVSKKDVSNFQPDGQMLHPVYNVFIKNPPWVIYDPYRSERGFRTESVKVIFIVRVLVLQ